MHRIRQDTTNLPGRNRISSWISRCSCRHGEASVSAQFDLRAMKTDSCTRKSGWITPSVSRIFSYWPGRAPVADACGPTERTIACLYSLVYSNFVPKEEIGTMLGSCQSFLRTTPLRETPHPPAARVYLVIFSGARRGGASLRDPLNRTRPEINVPNAYHESSVRNQGQVPRGSEAARVAQAAATPEVRDLYRRESKAGGYVRKGGPAALKSSEESRKMRPWSEVSDGLTYRNGRSTFSGMNNIQ